MEENLQFSSDSDDDYSSFTIDNLNKLSEKFAAAKLEYENNDTDSEVFSTSSSIENDPITQSMQELQQNMYQENDGIYSVDHIFDRLSNLNQNQHQKHLSKFYGSDSDSSETEIESESSSEVEEMTETQKEILELENRRKQIEDQMKQRQRQNQEKRENELGSIKKEMMKKYHQNQKDDWDPLEQKLLEKLGASENFNQKKDEENDEHENYLNELNDHQPTKKTNKEKSRELKSEEDDIDENPVTLDDLEEQYNNSIKQETSNQTDIGNDSKINNEEFGDFSDIEKEIEEARKQTQELEEKQRRKRKKEKIVRKLQRIQDKYREFRQMESRLMFRSDMVAREREDNESYKRRKRIEEQKRIQEEKRKERKRIEEAKRKEQIEIQRQREEKERRKVARRSWIEDKKKHEENRRLIEKQKTKEKISHQLEKYQNKHKVNSEKIQQKHDRVGDISDSNDMKEESEENITSKSKSDSTSKNEFSSQGSSPRDIIQRNQKSKTSSERNSSPKSSIQSKKKHANKDSFNGYSNLQKESLNSTSNQLLESSISNMTQNFGDDRQLDKVQTKSSSRDNTQQENDNSQTTNVLSSVDLKFSKPLPKAKTHSIYGIAVYFSRNEEAKITLPTSNDFNSHSHHSILEMHKKWVGSEKSKSNSQIQNGGECKTEKNVYERKYETQHMNHDRDSILDENFVENLYYPFPLSSIIHADISFEGITQVDPDAFYQCKKLEALSLNMNSLTFPPKINNGNSIMQLELEDNRLVSLKGMENLTQIYFFSASTNKIRSLEYLAFCSNISEVNLSNNKIDSLRGVQNLNKLTSLSLFRNRLDCLKGIGQIPNLIHLDAGRNKITQFEEDIQGCSLLTNLVLYKNRISSINRLSQALLQYLWLNGNQITRLPQEFLYAPLLKQLDLSENQISELSPFTGCLLLSTLNLSFNNISDLSQIDYLSHCKYLSILQLNDNPIESERFYRIHSINKLPNLRELDNTPISKEERHQIENKRNEIYLQQSKLHQALNRQCSIQNISKFCFYKFQSMNHDNQVKFKNSPDWRKISGLIEKRKSRELQSFEEMCLRQQEEYAQLSYHEKQSLYTRTDSVKNQHVLRRQLELKKQFLESKKLMINRHYKEHLEFQSEKEENVFFRNDSYIHRRWIYITRKCAIVIQKWYRALNQKWKLKEKRFQENKAKIIQAVWRGYWSRKTSLESIVKHLNHWKMQRDRSALIIQKIWRGYRVRKILWRARNPDLNEFDDDLDYDEEEYAKIDDSFFMPSNMDFSIRIPEHVPFQHNSHPEIHQFERSSFDNSQPISDNVLNDSDSHEIYKESITSSHADNSISTNEKDLKNDETEFQSELMPNFSKSSVERETRSQQGHESITEPTADKRLNHNTKIKHKSDRTHESGQANKSEQETNQENDSNSKEETKLEKIAREWGFKDTKTAKKMMQNMKKMNSVKTKKKKEKKLKDPQTRFQLFSKRKGSSSSSSSTKK